MKGTLIILLMLSGILAKAQETSQSDYTQKVWRVNFVNPGVELELSTGKSSTFSIGTGIGYGGSYPDLSFNNNGFQYIITPFIDLQEKFFYNFEKRLTKNKIIANNSGNFVSARVLIRGNSITENFERTSDFDFAFGPTWGIQRKYGKSFHLLFDVGPIYYMDTEGKGNLFPIMVQINLGMDL